MTHTTSTELSVKQQRNAVQKNTRMCLSATVFMLHEPIAVK